MSTNRVIMVMLDGLRYDTAIEQMGYLGHLVEKGAAARYKVKSEVPSMSRPLYEVLLTGTPPIENGITSNSVVRLSTEESIFHLTKQNGLTNATASYSWVSELYNKAPFNPYEDRIQHNSDMPIQHGIFYWEDHYPDTHLFADGHHLLETIHPDFLYIHSMNIDDEGHKHTANSPQYRTSAIQADVILANIMPKWLEKGYQVIITADHGMNDDGQHGGMNDDVRNVPLFIVSNKVAPGIYEEEVPQLMVAPLVCHLLNIEPSSKMHPLYLPGLKD